MRRWAWLWAPLVVLVLLAAPSIWFMLPSYQSELGENYEPLKTLKFAASLGSDFHKYGPMTSFLLLPPYALAIAYWRLTGAFSSPSGDFPYGLADPLGQLTVLILLARVLFLALFLSGCAALLVEVARLLQRRAATSLAFTFCIATSYAAAMYAANDRPDGPAFAFVALALAMYVRILRVGPTTRDACLMSLFAVCAISSKELAGPVFVLPYLGLFAHYARRTNADSAARRALLRVAVASVATGVGSYLLLNVIYAPATWLQRMQHWLGGEGTSKEVWLGVAQLSIADQLRLHVESFFGVLGPAGTAATLLALGTLALARPRRALLLSLPFVSITALGLAPLGFPGERFYMLAAATLVPPVALGLAELWTRSGAAARAALRVGVALGLVANFLLGTLAWHRLEGLNARVVENSLRAHPPGDKTLNLFDTFARPVGKSRLEWLGYRVDPRSIQEILAGPADALPRRIYVQQGYLVFLDEAKHVRARAEMLRHTSGFEVSEWHGLEALGYREIARVDVRTPWWFPYDRLPSVSAWLEESRLSIFELPG